MVLADQGADVVKVEPPTGDAIRTVGTGHAGMSAYFANNNRGKRSIAVDLTNDAGRDIVRRLTANADVFAQNFRPGVIDRLGLSAESLQAENPRLIYASISGFGTTGPLAGAPAYDHVVQALSGFAAMQTAGTSEPSMVRHGVIDKATAYTLAQAITAALFQRERTGQGTRIDVSMLDVAIAFLWPDGMMDHTVDEPSTVLPPTSRSFRVSPTADGHVVLVTLTAAQWSGLTSALLGDDGAAMTDTAERMKGGADVMRHEYALSSPTCPPTKWCLGCERRTCPWRPCGICTRWPTIHRSSRPARCARSSTRCSAPCTNPDPHRCSTAPPRSRPRPLRCSANTPTRCCGKRAGTTTRSRSYAPPVSSTDPVSSARPTRRARG